MASFWDNLIGNTGVGDIVAGGVAAGQAQAAPLLQQGRTALTTNFGKAASPYSDLLKYATPGTDLYARLSGAAPGSTPDTINQTLGGIPGFQFALDRSTAAIDRGAAAKGLLQTGGTVNAEQQNATNLANQYYFNYLKALEPYLNLRQNAASGYAGVQTGLGKELAGSYGSEANLDFNSQLAIANARAQQAQQEATAQQNLFGQGVKLATAGFGAAGGFPGMSAFGTSTPSPIGWSPAVAGPYG